jgi:hypothetical protein
LGLDPGFHGAPEGIELSGAGALGASHFGFDALDRVLHSDSQRITASFRAA